MLSFSLDLSSRTPIYRQIVQGVERALQEGALQPGDKLPTVRELAASLYTAGGTVKRAYDELCRKGVLRMTQGKGTFVAPRESLDSRKERAMAAIDAMVNTLEDLSFSPQEIEIYLQLKLRERLLRSSGVRTALICGCPEVLRMLADRLCRLEQAELYPIALTPLLEAPGRLLEEMELIAADDADLGALSPLLEGREPVRLFVRLTEDTARRLSRLAPGARLGLLAQSDAFARRMGQACDRLCPEHVPQGVFLPGSAQPLGAFLSQCDAVVLPAGLEATCSREEQEALEAFNRAHVILRAELEPDEGSLCALRSRLLALRRNRR